MLSASSSGKRDETHDRFVKHGRYRPNVAGILQREDGKILVAERAEIPEAWQFPQGGIDEGEGELEALHRELEEELGVPPSRYEVVGCRNGYRYAFPEGHRKRPDWIGQEQSYYLCRYLGPGRLDEFTLQGEHEEFSRVQWIRPGEFRLAWLPDFKRAVYEQVFADFFGVALA